MWFVILLDLPGPSVVGPTTLSTPPLAHGMSRSVQSITEELSAFASSLLPW